MPVFRKDDLTILYIHVPKSGGTAIELFFEKNGFEIDYVDRTGTKQSLNRVRRCSPQHMHTTQLREIFDTGRFSHVFMSVRHPVSRIISEYKMRLSVQPNVPEFSNWVHDTLRQYQTNPFVLDNHIRPQSEFWLPGCRVFRQEDGFGPEFVAELSRFLSVKFSDQRVDHAMRFDNVKNVAVPVPHDTKALLDVFYRMDFSLFGY